MRSAGGRRSRIVALGSIAISVAKASEVAAGAIAPEPIASAGVDAPREDVRTTRLRRDAARPARAAGGTGGDRRVPREALPGAEDALARGDRGVAGGRDGRLVRTGAARCGDRPPRGGIDKGAGIVALLSDTELAAAVYVGDDVNDDAFAA